MPSLVARAIAYAHAPALALVACVVALPAQAADQLNLAPDPMVTVVLLLAFIVLIFPLQSLIFGPLVRVMEERAEKIDGAKARAARVQEQAQEAIDRYEESIRNAYEAVGAERRRKIDVARGELASVTQQARADADRELTRAREELEASLGDARETLRAGSEELANLAAERILGRSLS